MKRKIMGLVAIGAAAVLAGGGLVAGEAFASSPAQQQVVPSVHTTGQPGCTQDGTASDHAAGAPSDGDCAAGTHTDGHDVDRTQDSTRDATHPDADDSGHHGKVQHDEVQHDGVQHDGDQHDQREHDGS